MSDKIIASASIRRLADLYKDMVVASDALEQIGQVEQTLQEVNQQIESARVELDSVKELTKQEKLNVQKARSDAAKKLSDADAQAKLIICNAENEASGILDDATEKANKILAGANENAVGVKRDLQVEIELLDGEVKAANAELERVQATVKAKQAESDALDAKLTEIKAKLAKFLGE